ncbi:uncharacterized protein [Amphiura filiformis]|uniref:uncharacterized protein isoform X2 n=1 Tax=Amphiura filiformis TaxID=82378 RepID=UPI003B21729E
MEWRQRMSAFVSGLPNFALGSTTRDYTRKRPRLFSDNSSRYHDAVSLEKRSQRLRYRRGTTSSSGSDWSADLQGGEGVKADSERSSSREEDNNSTYSRFSSCSSRDSIQHWVDSLDLDDNENDVTVLPGHQGNTGRGSRGPSLDYTPGANPENIPGYGQPVPKKGSIGTTSVDDLRLGADASCITNGTTVAGSQVKANGGDVSPGTKRRVGSGGRVLERRLTNSQLIEQAQQHRTIQGRRQQLHHMGGSGLSDTPSDYSVRTASSISELLLMRNDPEEILLALGFGGRKKTDNLDRIPSRFLQSSQMKGISVQGFLHRMEEIERGYGFNICGGLRGLQFVLDRRRTNSLIKQNSIEQEEEEEDKEVKESKETEEQASMGNTSNKESSPVEERVTSPVANEPSLEEIYTQRQPPHIRRFLNRYDSSLESRDSGPLLSSRDSTASENESFDQMSRMGSLDNNNLRSKDCDDGAKDASARTVSSFPTKEVFHSSNETSRESSVEKESSSVPVPVDEGSDSNGNINAGALTEEQINEIREELMLRAQIVRARMVMPSPQLAPVDEESETDTRSTPYRVGSLDTVAEERTPDGRKSSPTTENAPVLKEDKPKASNLLRTMSTPEMELYHPRNQKRSPPQTKDAKASSGSHASTGDDSNKLRPVVHKVAERLLKDNNGHGGQESFEIEEISSTENQDESGSPSNKTEEKPSEHGTLSRNPSTQSDSSGFADEGDTPTNGASGNQDNSDACSTMTNTEVQTSFDTVGLDSYEQGSFSSRPSSIDTHVSEHDIRRLAERRESFRKSRGTSIVTTATFNSMDLLDDDDAFLTDDISDITCGRNTPVSQETVASSKPRPLRRSGTFPGLIEKPAQHGGPKTVPEILTSLKDSLQKPNLAREDGASSPELSERRRRMMSSKMYSVDLERYDARVFEDHSSNWVTNSANNHNNKNSSDAELACEASSHSIADAEFQVESLNNLIPVCEEQIVPSNTESETLSANSAAFENVARPQPDPVHRINEQNSTESIPLCLSPTLESWDTSDFSSHSRSTESEPFRNYTPLLSPPPSSSSSVLPDDSKLTLPSKAPPIDRVWQVMDTAHHLEQHRLSQGSQNPTSVCVSELNAKCEPREEGTERLRSSLEMEISGQMDERSLPEDEHLHSQDWSANPVLLSPDDEAENWHRAMAATGTPTMLPDKKFSQYEVEDIQVLQTALVRYKNDLSELEAKSGLVYGSVEQELTESDRCELEALHRVRHQIMGEIATMETLIEKKLQRVNSPKKMVSLLEEQRSMQNFLQDLNNDTQVLQTHMSGKNTEEATTSSHGGLHTDVLVQELLSVKKELEEYRALAKKELKSAISELKVSIMAEVRREFSSDTKALHYQLQAKDDEIRRLRALLGETALRGETTLLGETNLLQGVSQLSLSSNGHEETERQKDELMQLKDLLLKRNSAMASHQPEHRRKMDQGEFHQSRNGKR